jgi:hypothetical protein
MIPTIYKKLLTLYPQEFRERLAESMEQTFNDLIHEKMQNNQQVSSIVLWTFAETITGIFREHLLLISPGAIMQTTLKNLGSSTLISFLITLPFIIMELVNRRIFNEEFPTALFFGMWLNLFAISLILLPIARSRWAKNHDIAKPTSTKGVTLPTSPKSAAMISVFFILLLIIVSLLKSLGGERLLNGLNPEQFYMFGVRVSSQFIGLIFLPLPIVAGIIAAGPIVRTLRAGGSLFAHPIHLIIVIIISFLLAAGFVSLIADQWPCFMGVPNCD